MAFLERVRSKGKTYLYLKEYESRPFYENKSVTIYSFGRIENAKIKLLNWRENFYLFPEELRRKGFCEVDLNEWINTLQTGIHKTGKKFKI